MSTQQIDRVEWLKARRNSIGASEAAAVLGLHPYHSPMSLYYDKTTDSEPSAEETEYQEWGHLLETPLASKYARVTKREVLTVEHPDRPFIHPLHPFVTASPDRFFSVKNPEVDPATGPLELKTSDRFKADEELPVHWQVQIQQQLAVLGMEVGSFAILGPFRKFYTVDIQRNDEFISLLMERLQEFWERHVLARVPPAADGHSATTEALKRLYPKETGARVELASEFTGFVEKLEDVQSTIKSLESEEKEIKNRILAAIGDATFGVLPDGTGFSLKTVERKGFTTEPTSFRQLRRVKKGIL